jgi:hypothetical protein
VSDRAKNANIKKRKGKCRKNAELPRIALSAAPLLRVLRTEIIDAGAIAQQGECAHKLAANFVQCGWITTTC